VTRSVVYSPQARQQLTDIYHWIAAASSFADRAEGFASEIFDFCDGLASFPMLGVARDGLRPGLRIVGFRRRVTIAFVINEKTVEVLGIYCGAATTKLCSQPNPPEIGSK
jgi:plasmid stabilization system protein ParE